MERKLTTCIIGGGTQCLSLLGLEGAFNVSDSYLDEVFAFGFFACCTVYSRSRLMDPVRMFSFIS